MGVNQSASDLSIVNSVLAGNHSSYEELVLRHKDYAYSIALRILNNSMDAEEVAHDAFVKAFRSLKNFNQQAKFTTWLYRIVFNTAISRKRKAHNLNTEIEAADKVISDSPQPEALVEQEERAMFIKDAMAKLQPVDATILTLFYMKQLNLEEIGQITGTKANSVKVKLHRARKRLAIELNSLLNQEAIGLI